MESEDMGPAGSSTGSSAVKLWIPPCGLAALILLLSSTPGTYYPRHPDFINSIVHFMEFGFLSFLLARALHYTYSLTSTGLFLWTAAICISFGLLDEAHQFMVPERMFDLMDLLFDSLGAAAGSASYIFLSAIKTGSSGTNTAAAGDMDD
jgi:VanZ family protein